MSVVLRVKIPPPSVYPIKHFVTSAVPKVIVRVVVPDEDGVQAGAETVGPGERIVGPQFAESPEGPAPRRSVADHREGARHPAVRQTESRLGVEDREAIPAQAEGAQQTRREARHPIVADHLRYALHQKPFRE